jgi:hypothetical protein
MQVNGGGPFPSDWSSSLFATETRPREVDKPMTTYIPEDDGAGLKVMNKRLDHVPISITSDIYDDVRAEVDQRTAHQIADLILGGAG